MQVQMTPKVMAYFLKDDYYLKADVYDKVTLHYLLFFHNWKQMQEEKSFNIHCSQSTTTTQYFYLLVDFINKLKVLYLAEEIKYLSASSNYIRQSLMYCVVQKCTK